MSDSPPVRVRRSARRKRTVSARMSEGVVIVDIPAWFSRAEEQRYVAEMIAKVQAREAAREARTRRGRTDEDLMARAHRLAAAYDLEVPDQIRWVTNQQRRWGSCSSTSRVIRLSHRMQSFPDYVIDAVVVHELAHLTHPDHGPGFQALVARYPRLERAEGFLEGVDAESGRPSEDW